jgi:hypothetical protein
VPPLAPLTDFVKRLGYTPAGTEGDRAEFLLDAASELIRDVTGKTWLNEAEDAVEDVPRRVQRICIEIAYRAFGNPQALSQRTLGDDSKSFDRSGREGGEAVYLTDAEASAVCKAAGIQSSFVAVTLASPYTYVPGSDPDDDVVFA